MTACSPLTVQHDLDRSITVAHAGRPLLEYVYRPCDLQLESPRPYVHPLRTLGGDVVSLLRPHDHVWHKGLAWSLPKVGPHNFWGGPTYVRHAGYQQLDNDGSMDHVGFSRLAIDDGRVEVAHDLAWHTQPAPGAAAGAEVVREQRSLSVCVPADDAWVLVFASTLTNVSASALDLGSPTTEGRENAGYGGLFWRGPRSFSGGTVVAPGRSGSGEDVRGVRAEWLGFTGRHDGSGRDSALVMVDDVANPQHPPQWFVRDEPYACLCPAPFFSERIPFAPGATLTFRYAVVVADGAADPDRGKALAALGRDALAAPTGAATAAPVGDASP